MTKYCLNHESGQCGYIDEDGHSCHQHKYVYNWGDSEYVWEHEQEREQEKKEEKIGYLWVEDDCFLF